jgi:hypothetical protein
MLSHVFAGGFTTEPKINVIFERPQMKTALCHDILRSHNIELAKQECHFLGETLVDVCCGKDFVNVVQSTHCGI